MSYAMKNSNIYSIKKVSRYTRIQTVGLKCLVEIESKRNKNITIFIL